MTLNQRLKNGLAVVYATISPFFLFCQNLVPNSSFEDTIACPTQIGFSCPSSNLGSFDAIYYWTNPICTSPEIFHSCTSNSNIDVPTNIAGTQLPKTGNAYAGIWCGSGAPSPTFNEYVTSPLTQTLVAGNIYCVSFFVSYSGYMSFQGSDGIGALLSVGFPDTIGSKQANKILMQAQVNNPIGNVITDQTNWIQIWDTIIAQGGEDHITIGNFTPDSILNGDGGYYYIDDVEVKLCNDISVGEEKEKNRFKVFPNPVEDFLNVEFEKVYTGRIKLIDLTGKIIFTENVINQKRLKMSVAEINAGLYFLQLENEDGISSQAVSVTH